MKRPMQGLVKLGVQKRGFAERYGGLGIRSAVTVCAITEEISRGDSGLSLHALIIPWCMAAAMGGRNQVLMDKFIPMFCEDTPRCGCLAITEPAGGCNVEDGAERAMTIRTTARLDGDEWVINGEKMWPSGASIADLYCVICTTDPGPWGRRHGAHLRPKRHPGPHLRQAGAEDGDAGHRHQHGHLL